MKESREVPSISFDYCFCKNRPGDATAVILAGRERDTGMYINHVVPCKGAEVEWVAGRIHKDIQRLGIFGRAILRSDGEPAIVGLLQEVARLRTGAVTVLEKSPKGDSQANGLAERAVRGLEELLRVHKLDLESRVGCTLQMDHPCIEWLVEYTTDVLNKYQVGQDGRTPYTRAKGRRYSGEMYQFATPVNFRSSGKLRGALWLLVGSEDSG